MLIIFEGVYNSRLFVQRDVRRICARQPARANGYLKGQRYVCVCICQVFVAFFSDEVTQY